MSCASCHPPNPTKGEGLGDGQTSFCGLGIASPWSTQLCMICSLLQGPSCHINPPQAHEAGNTGSSITEMKGKGSERVSCVPTSHS